MCGHLSQCPVTFFWCESVNTSSFYNNNNNGNSDAKRPDGTTILPWSRGRPLAWDVTVPDTYAESQTFTWWTQPEKREQQPTMQRPTKTPSTASYPTLMCSFWWPLRRGYISKIKLMAPSGGGTGTGDWKTDGKHYRRCQGVYLPVPAAVRGTIEWECGLISKYVHRQLARCNPLLQKIIISIEALG